MAACVVKVLGILVELMAPPFATPGFSFTLEGVVIADIVQKRITGILK